MHDWLIRIERTDDLVDWRLVASDPATPGRPLGQLQLHPGTGERVPRHWYHLGTAVHAAPDLKLFHRQRTLLLGNDLTGAIELLGWRCEDAGAGHAPGVLDALLQAAVLWCAREAAMVNAPVVSQRLFAELPGWRDELGHSPFWQGLGQHFLPLTPAQAARRFGPHWAREAAALMPRHPLLVALLPEEAQDALSRAAPDAAAMAQALEREGLVAGQHVTLVDGGPVHENALAALRSARGSAWRVLRAGDVGDSRCWLASTSAPELHQLAGLAHREELILDAEVMSARGWKPGERVWCAPGQCQLAM